MNADLVKFSITESEFFRPKKTNMLLHDILEENHTPIGNTPTTARLFSSLDARHPEHQNPSRNDALNQLVSPSNSFHMNPLLHHTTVVTTGSRGTPMSASQQNKPSNLININDLQSSFHSLLQNSPLISGR